MEPSVNRDNQCMDESAHSDDCPNHEYAASASEFISNVSLDTMHAIAEEALRKKRIAAATEEPKWVIPDFLDN